MLERRQGRQTALEMLYEREITGFNLKEILVRKVSGLSSQAAADFAGRLVLGVSEHRQEIDGLIDTYAENWSIERLAVIDRNILRIALYEMLYEPDIPVSVSINEAIELAKAYGSPESAKFINGILGKIALSLDKGKRVEGGK